MEGADRLGWLGQQRDEAGHRGFSISASDQPAVRRPGRCPCLLGRQRIVWVNGTERCLCSPRVRGASRLFPSRFGLSGDSPFAQAHGRLWAAGNRPGMSRSLLNSLGGELLLATDEPMSCDLFDGGLWRNQRIKGADQVAHVARSLEPGESAVRPPVAHSPPSVGSSARPRHRFTLRV